MKTNKWQYIEEGIKQTQIQTNKLQYIEIEAKKGK